MGSGQHGVWNGAIWKSLQPQGRRVSPASCGGLWKSLGIFGNLSSCPAQEVPPPCSASGADLVLASDCSLLPVPRIRGADGKIEDSPHLLHAGRVLALQWTHRQPAFPTWGTTPPTSRPQQAMRWMDPCAPSSPRRFRAVAEFAVQTGRGLNWTWSDLAAR